MANISSARAAKNKLADRLRGVKQVNGVGLSRKNDGWIIKVNLVANDPRAAAQIPSELDGVEVTVEVVGPIRAQTG